MIKAHVHENGSSKANGTSLLEYINITYAELCDLFGEPLGPSSDNKVAAEWHVSLYEQGSDWTGPEDAFVTIYNYKDGRNYDPQNGLNVQDITSWHVGGKSPIHAHILEEFIGQQEEYLKLLRS